MLIRFMFLLQLFKMNKLLNIPRAIIDILKIWKSENSLREKSSFTYTLIFLKWKKWKAAVNEVIDVPIQVMRWTVYNNEATQFLFKEIFINEVYKIPAGIIVNKILDVGSNIGLTALYFNKNTNSEIVALEPGASAFNLLRQNIDRLKKAGIIVHQTAAADFDGKLFEKNNDVINAASINETFSIE